MGTSHLALGRSPPVLSWWEEREAAETRVPSDLETQPEAEKIH